MIREERDAGLATVWAAAGVAVLMGALLVGLHLGAAIVARHRAEAAADLAALAAAGLGARGAPAACARAEDIASRMSGRISRCELSGWDAVVEVEIPVPGGLPGAGVATGRARAGPAPDLSPEELGAPAQFHRPSRRRTFNPVDPLHDELQMRPPRRTVDQHRRAGDRPRPAAGTGYSPSLRRFDVWEWRSSSLPRRSATVAGLGARSLAYWVCSYAGYRPHGRHRERSRSPDCGGVGASPPAPPIRFHRVSAVAGRSVPR